MGFAAYWKEIAAVLAGLFAIGGLLAEVKDKRTGKFTIWGRVFLTLTVLSTIGGIYAQWIDSAEQQKHNKEAQEQTLKLLKSTQKSVHDLSRLLQPIDNVDVDVFYKLDCTAVKLKAFCASVTSRAKVEGLMLPNAIRGTGIFSVRNVDWSKWPRDLLLFDYVMLYFFKNRNDADQFLKKRNAMNVDGDMSLQLLLQPGMLGKNDDHLSVEFDARDGGIEFMVVSHATNPKINNDRLLSAVDIPGATLVLMDNSAVFHLRPTSILLTTGRGQTIETDSLEPVTVHFDTFDVHSGTLKASESQVFIHHFKSLNDD